MKLVNCLASICLFFLISTCTKQTETVQTSLKDPAINYESYEPKPTDMTLSREAYKEHLYGFWLGQCIANWTGLVTEMDKIGNIGEIQTGAFYTSEDWGKPDQPSIFSDGEPSQWSETIDFVFRDTNEVWGADDDTDIEYMYQHLLYTNKTSMLTGEQIKEGWLRHIMAEEENYLWVSNQAAFDLMKQGVTPPETSNPDKNPHYDMIDAQLTTEIFGLFAPGRPDIAIEMAKMPIRTTARANAEVISEFYVIMHALAAKADNTKSMKEQVFELAQKARQYLPDTTYPAKMYDLVYSMYEANYTWEAARDSLYQRYQVEEADGYDITSQQMTCNGCFAAGINFGAGMVSLFYGEGDIKETIKIGALAGWDSDNPTATWGGLLGFMLGKKGVEEAFGRKFSEQFNIHRTRQNFPDNGLDNFNHMAEIGVYIIDRVVQEKMSGGVDLTSNSWYIPSE